MTLPARTLHRDRCIRCEGRGFCTSLRTDLSATPREFTHACDHGRDPTLMLSDDEEELLALRNEVERMKRAMLEAADMLDAEGAHIAAAKLREDVGHH